MNSTSYKRFILVFFLIVLTPVFLCSNEAGAQKKTKKQREKKPAAAVETKMPETPKIKKDGEGKKLENSLTTSVKIDIAKFIKDSMAAISNKNPGQTVKLNVTAQLASDSSEIMVFNYSERYAKPISLKAEVSEKYSGSNYFILESDYNGMRGVHITSKPSAPSHIDIVGYQVSTDSIIIGYMMPDPKILNVKNSKNIKPKIISEGAFYRQAMDSALAWKHHENFNFYDNARLKKFRSSSIFGEPMSISSIGIEGKNQNISIFAYKDFLTASGIFPTLKLSKEVPRETAKNKKSDALYDYYLNDRFIIAISSGLE